MFKQTYVTFHFYRRISFTTNNRREKTSYNYNTVKRIKVETKSRYSCIVELLFMTHEMK